MRSDEEVRRRDAVGVIVFHQTPREGQVWWVGVGGCRCRYNEALEHIVWHVGIEVRVDDLWADPLELRGKAVLWLSDGKVNGAERAASRDNEDAEGVVGAEVPGGGPGEDDKVGNVIVDGENGLALWHFVIYFFTEAEEMQSADTHGLGSPGDDEEGVVRGGAGAPCETIDGFLGEGTAWLG